MGPRGVLFQQRINVISYDRDAELQLNLEVLLDELERLRTPPDAQGLPSAPWPGMSVLAFPAWRVL